VGFFFYAWLVLQFGVRIFRQWHRSNDPVLKALLCAGILMFAGHMFHLLFHPVFYTSVTGIAYGLINAAWGLGRRRNRAVAIPHAASSLPEGPGTASRAGQFACES